MAAAVILPRRRKSLREKSLSTSDILSLISLLNLMKADHKGNRDLRDFATDNVLTLEPYTSDSYPVQNSACPIRCVVTNRERVLPDRKSTRLNSSHANISYAVFCL